MRIGFVTTTYLPSRNGVATSTALFAQGLRSLGHEVSIYAPNHPTRPPAEDGVYRLPSTMMGTPADYPVLLWPNPPAVAGLPLRGTDIFHTMHPFLPGILARFWARRFQTPVVFTAHTQYEQYLHYAPLVPRRVSRSLTRAHVAAFARSVDQVLVPGRAMAEMLGDYGYGGSVALMPNPVNLQAFQAADTPEIRRAVRERYGVPDEAPLVISLGRLAAEKNLDVMLRAFDEARQRRPDLRLLVVGDGPVKSALEARRPQGAVFTGALPYAEVPQLLAAADVFITASTSEVLPMSMIEALAAGTPLVAARSPAAEDLIHTSALLGENGLIREAHAGALAEGLLSALEPATLPRRRAAARASAQQYDLRVRAKALLGVYEGLLSKRSSVT
ncbi:glycosyltransferase family 4 protein [Deinococcus psychrotolerans]|uniref:Glycosyltransferase family 4 protein n=1 Tax=Deinococcus psychrotolerans TaxID=2489213 RepID=A0A3G8YAV3_9DEIO|nr:glycosyltransferase [Deinococcus psychrotolerans]AZI42438.1 glycosyltransferase family 4 protein [Deinococcus psychrotolerans]